MSCKIVKVSRLSRRRRTGAPFVQVGGSNDALGCNWKHSIRSELQLSHQNCTHMYILHMYGVPGHAHWFPHPYTHLNTHTYSGVEKWTVNWKKSVCVGVGVQGIHWVLLSRLLVTLCPGRVHPLKPCSSSTNRRKRKKTRRSSCLPGECTLTETPRPSEAGCRPFWPNCGAWWTMPIPIAWFAGPR